MTVELLLAAALVTGPSDADPALADILRPQIIAVSLAAEIVDPRETSWVTLGDLRCRWSDLADAPPPSDAERFPDEMFVRRALDLNRARRLRLSDRLAVDLIFAEGLRAEIAELDRRYEVWDSLRDARQQYYHVQVRRIALRRLREMIGDEGYAMGRMPRAVP